VNAAFGDLRCRDVKSPRRLDATEIESLLALDVPARLATLDRHGFPHITPLWFIWADGSFFMTSIADRPHVRRLARNARAGLASTSRTRNELTASIQIASCALSTTPA
jgi:nitroimidazol reductase NimA-like FMN-containing flavoprotein (pyridoxamine 5'-phosphate oxidase superfamily)